MTTLQPQELRGMCLLQEKELSAMGVLRVLELGLHLSLQLGT